VIVGVGAKWNVRVRVRFRIRVRVSFRVTVRISAMGLGWVGLLETVDLSYNRPRWPESGFRV